VSIRQTTLHSPGNVQPTESVRWLAAACIVTDQKETKVLSLHHLTPGHSLVCRSLGWYSKPARSQDEVFWASGFFRHTHISPARWPQGLERFSGSAAVVGAGPAGLLNGSTPAKPEADARAQPPATEMLTDLDQWAVPEC
jgi:hypothetical protein